MIDHDNLEDFRDAQTYDLQDEGYDGLLGPPMKLTTLSFTIIDSSSSKPTFLKREPPLFSLHN